MPADADYPKQYLRGTDSEPSFLYTLRTLLANVLSVLLQVLSTALSRVYKHVSRLVVVTTGSD